MNKKTTILLHAASWLAILCAPLMYIDRSTTFDVLRYLFFCMAPALLMVVFYANYLWLVPKYYIKGNRLHFSIANICMMIRHWKITGRNMHLEHLHCKDTKDLEKWILTSYGKQLLILKQEY